MVRVRFAPSPTGFLHIGSARTALFNWLFASHEKGEFLLRIEDTDKARSKGEFIDETMASLKWLGLDWSEDPVYQSKRIDIYKKAAENLIKQDKAYRDGDAIRFRMPKANVKVSDMTRGEIEFEAESLKDEVLIKSDGFPAYNFACVIDDTDMRITHVIRGDDHISNTPKQAAMYKALGYDIPKFAHIPLIMGPDGGRMSKRHGATSIMEYKKLGYLSDALVNFLALIGWSPGDDREIFSKDELAREFTFKKVNKASAVFGIDKLNWINAQHIKEKDSKELAELAAPFLKERGIIGHDFDREKLLNLIELYKVRMHTLADFPDQIKIFYSDMINYDEKAVKKHLNAPQAKEILLKWKERLEGLDSFDKETLEENCRALAGELEIKPAKLIHPTRVAISGRTVGAGVFEMMEAMGRDTVLKRLEYTVQNLAL